jgi:hydrogenase maturation protease
MTKSILVLGYGTPIRGDDSLGWVVIDELRKKALPENVRLESHHMLLPEHVFLFEGYDKIIFVDIEEGEEPGKVTRYDLSQAQINEDAFTHVFSPQKLLSMTGDYFGTTPAGVLFTLTGQEFDYKEGLSEPVQNALPALLQKIESEIESSMISTPLQKQKMNQH